MIVLESTSINRAVKRIENLKNFKLVEIEGDELYHNYFLEFLRRAAIWRQRIEQAGYTLFDGQVYSSLPFFDINRFWGEPFELPKEYLVIIDEVTSIKDLDNRWYKKIFPYYLKFEIMKENKMLDNFEPNMYVPFIKMTEIGGCFSYAFEDISFTTGRLDAITIWKYWKNKYKSPPFIEFGE